MKLWVFVLILLLTTFGVNGDNRNQHGAEIEDNEFAEFEDFDEDVVELASEGDLPGEVKKQMNVTLTIVEFNRICSVEVVRLL